MILPLRSTRARRAAGVFLLAASVRVLYAATIAGSGCLAINSDPVSDMETFHRWALRIVEGDWLGRAEFHPYHPWQRDIAPESVWLGWYGPGVFHQDPLYPYLVALLYAILPRSPSSVVGLQLLLGALTAAGVFLLADRLSGPRAAAAAGVLAALYGPFLFYESLLLRDTLLVSLTTAFLIALEAARRREGWGPWAAAGALAGAVYLTKPNVAAFLPLLACWILAGGEVRRRAGAAAGLAAGFALALLPVAARNAAVGAPPLKTTTRGAVEFINGNNPYHGGVGWFDEDDPRVAAYARAVLVRTRMRLLPTVAEVLGTWRGRAGDFARLQVRKLGWLLAPFEMPNNASYAYFRSRSPVLGAGLPTFYVISPLAALGLIASARRWRRLVPYYLFLAAGGAVTVAFYVIARFRIPYLPLLLVFAGEGAARLVELAGERRWRALATSSAAVVGLLALNASFNHPDSRLMRPQDFLVTAGHHESAGDLRRAIEELEEGRRLLPDFAPLHEAAAKVKEKAGDLPGARAAWAEARRLDPASREAAEALRRLRPAGPDSP